MEALILFAILAIIAIIIFGLAFIPANIASKKGYGFIGFYILGVFFFLFALIVSLCLSNKRQHIDEIKKAIYSEKNSLSVADELKKYSDLLERGIISQEEFDNIKRKLISM